MVFLQNPNEDEPNPVPCKDQSTSCFIIGLLLWITHSLWYVTEALENGVFQLITSYVIPPFWILE